MLKIRKTQKLILMTLCAFGFNSNFEIPAVSARSIYESHTDTGTDIFDYIENRRRARRANDLTEEQKKFVADMEEVRQRLPNPIENGESVPAAFEGDDLTYNTLTGEFIAKGNVDIIQLDGHRFQSSQAAVNIHTKEVQVKGKAHVLQLTEGAPRITLDGYNTFYNYGTKEGTMGNAKGKLGEYYISGKRFEFYPDHIVIYDAYQTKCGAKHPDYRLSAKRMEIWPEQIIRMYDVKFWIGEVVIGTKNYLERKIGETLDPYFPSVGYSSKRGVYISDIFEFPVINNHFKFVLDAHYETKNGIRSNGEFNYTAKNFLARTLYGYYYDSDGRWIKKEPGLYLHYSKHFDHLPLSYDLKYEIGDWSITNISSTHQEIEGGLTRDPINLGGRYNLFLNASYKITKDNVKTPYHAKQTVKGFNYSIKLAKEFNDRFAAFAAFDYSKNTSQNSLYEFDTDSYSNRFSTGISYRLTDKDRFVVGWKFNTDHFTLEDVDYYWYRDLHCSTAIVRWRQRRDEWEVRWQFTPW